LGGEQKRLLFYKRGPKKKACVPAFELGNQEKGSLQKKVRREGAVLEERNGTLGKPLYQVKTAKVGKEDSTEETGSTSEREELLNGGGGKGGRCHQRSN